MGELFPDQGGGPTPGLKFVFWVMVLLAFGLCTFFVALGYGVFEIIGTVGSAIIEVLDELWSQG